LYDSRDFPPIYVSEITENSRGSFTGII